MISVKVDLKANQVYAYLKEVPRAVSSAAARAINSMSPDVRSISAHEISSVYNIKEPTAKRAIKMVARASPNKLRAVWQPQGKGIPLSQYSPKVVGGKGRRANHPVSVEVFRGKRKVVQGAFRGVGRAPAKRKGAARTPTRTLYGPSIPMAFARDEVLKATIFATNKILPGRLESEMVRQLRKIETGRLPPVTR
jgi:hypothetical protein